MTGKLKMHSHEAEEDGEQDIDPRWAGLKNLQFEEDN
jgi:uncharacterized metal-binding protein YceD (DUF177 family)